MALLEKAAGQGHAYAMDALGDVHHARNEHEQAVKWFTKGAEAGLPQAMYALGCHLDEGQGVAAPDYPAAVGPDRYCPPRHSMDFDPSYLEINGQMASYDVASSIHQSLGGVGVVPARG